jgi:hypothetical protein
MARLSPHIDAIALDRRGAFVTAGKVTVSGGQAVHNGHDRLVS